MWTSTDSWQKPILPTFSNGSTRKNSDNSNLSWFQVEEKQPIRRDSNVSAGGLAWQRLKQSLSETEPKHTVKFLVICICIFLVYQQMDACLSKLRTPPLTTHTELTLVENMSYPALTVCREPPYNKRNYKKYGFTSLHLGSYPIVSQWEGFDFQKYNISDFFKNSVYTYAQVFRTLNMDSKEGNVRSQSSLHLSLGLCHTITPLNTTQNVGKKYGYTFSLVHDLFDYNKLLDDEPGYHIFLHEPYSILSEEPQILSSVDHLFVRVGEEMEINLETVEFNLLKNCNATPTYSHTQCEEECWQRGILENPNIICTGPWFPDMNLPMCTDYNGMREIYKATLAMKSHSCCMPRCARKQYKASVVSRTGNINQLISQVYVYYTSKAVLGMSESYAYDWNLFLADLGGSIGFLLGLSALSIISVVEAALQFVIRFKKRKMKKKEEVENQKNRHRIEGWRVPCPVYPITSSTLVAKIQRY